MSDEETEETSIKVVLVGESGVGKTSIIQQFIENEFSEKLPSTLASTFSSKMLQIDKTKLTLEIWDTVGQEKYRSLTKMFYKDAIVAVLVYDISRLESFTELKNFWATEVKANTTENCLLVICGNKNDLYLQEQIPESDAREFAASINALFFLTSAKNLQSVNTMFTEIGKKFASNESEEAPVQNEPQKKDVVQLDNSAETKEKKKSKCC